MAAASEKVRILLIRPWTEPLGALRDALRAAQISARISRVDIEPALNAALSRTPFDLVVLDPQTRGITLELVEERMREHRRFVPIVMFDAIDATVVAIQRALRYRFN
jgi:hypothetical protein